MSDSNLREQEESYRQLSPDELIEIYETSRREGKRREVDSAKRESWSWREVAYVLGLGSLLGLIIVQYLR